MFSTGRTGIYYYLVTVSPAENYLVIKALSLNLDGHSLKQLAEKIMEGYHQKEKQAGFYYPAPYNMRNMPNGTRATLMMKASATGIRKN
ncbi:MAG: hypothetical protein HC858_11500, partial [Brachymonas sp.]|nr:hypothetical protein [Brachymonas sp.]